MTPRAPEAIASLLAVNLTPIAGVLLLGWQPGEMLIAYFVDTLVGITSVMWLMMVHVTGDDQDTPVAGWARWAKLVGALVFLTAIILLPLALPVLIVLGADGLMRALFDSPGLRAALLVQMLMSVLATLRVHRELAATHDDDRILSTRFIFLIARWVAVFAVTATGIAGWFGQRYIPVVVIAVYGIASIWFELFPEHASRFLRGRQAPIKYEDDLETRAAKHRGEAPPKR